jgi:FAD/FMN-containing dehydrogenase
VDIVTGDGRLRTASAETDPDLLWAVRGGGGNFGIVTSFEFACHPVGPMVRLAAPVHPAHRAGELLRLVRGAAESVPEDVALLTVLWTGPEDPAVPEPYRGQPVAILLACHTGPPADAEQALRPFAEFGPPVADLGGPMAYRSLQRLLDPEYPDGRRYYWKSVYVPELTDGIIEALVRSGAGRPSPLSSVDVWTLGGAIGRFGPEHGPFARRGDRFLVAFEANWDDPGQDQANIAWTRASFAEVQALSRGPSYLNFPGFAEEGEAMLRGFYGGNYGRLREIKARYDPDNLFRGSVNIAP